MGSISITSTMPVQLIWGSTREWITTAWPAERLLRFSSLMVPLTRNWPEERMLIKGRGWPMESVPPFSLISFTVPSTSA